MICRKKEDHKRNLKMVRKWESPWLKNISPISRKSVVPVKDNASYPLLSYAGFKDGFILLDNKKDVYRVDAERPELKRLGPLGSKVRLIFPEYKHLTHRELRDSNELFKCFFFSKICLVVKYTPEKKTLTKFSPATQQLLIFNFTKQQEYSGVPFWQEDSRIGKFITSILPITKSSYFIIGFNYLSNSSLEHTPVLIRANYLETEQQFEYKIPKRSAKMITCDRLLYIEYSNYFSASFNQKNGVLVYDLTQSSKLPQMVFNPQDRDYPHMLPRTEQGRAYGYWLRQRCFWLLNPR